MRILPALLLSLCLASSGAAQRIEQSHGVTIIRGGSKPKPAASESASEAESGAAESAGETAREKAEKPAVAKRSATSSVAYKADLNGRLVRTPAAETSRREDGDSSSTRTARNLNGREVPYLSEQERVVRKSASTTVRERRTQRYDRDGKPAQQEVTQIEERKLADGTVETTETVYREDLNGRMRAVERRRIRESKRGSRVETVTTTEKPSINGRFRPFIEETTVENRRGESSGTIETVRRVGDGQGALQLASREEVAMSKSGSVSTTEKKVYERDALSGKMQLSTRQLGRLEERPDGSKTEKIETYGYQQAGGGRDANAARPRLQEVVERQTTVGADGVQRERTSVRGVDPVEPSRFSAPVVSETVSRPNGDGKSVRREFYEPDVNGRLRPTQVTIEQVEP